MSRQCLTSYGFGDVQGLSLTIGYFLLTNIILTPLLDLLDFEYFINLYKQSKIEEKLKLSRSSVHLTQKELNKMWEQPEVNFSAMYSSIITTFFVSCFFFYILPAGPFICLFYFFFQFWVNKYLVTKRNKKFQLLNSEMSIELSEFCEGAMVLVTAGTLLFRWKIHGQIYNLDIVAFVLALLVYFIPVATTIDLGARISETISKEEQRERRDSYGLYPQTTARMIPKMREIPFEEIFTVLDIE